MRFGSVCSGIEAASAAWGALGWEAEFVSEIEAFPSAVLAHHYPDVPNHGDMTAFKDWPDHAIDLLVGGTPCQSFSVAGLRAGLADPRGSLMLTYLAIAARYRPRWVVWENVPGVLSSNGGRDFGTFLGGLGELGYGFAYRVLDAQFCRASGFPHAVPQRRRRVFVVGYLGDWRRAAAVLFDASSLRGDSTPRREAGQGIAGTIDAGTHPGSYSGQDAYQGCLVPLQVAHSLRAEGFDASEDGTGRGTPLIAFDTTQITSKANRSVPKAGDPCHPLAAGAHAPTIAQIIPIDMRQASRGETMTNNRPEGTSGGAPGTGIGKAGDPAPTVASSHVPAVAFDLRGREGGAQFEGPHDTANVRAASGGSSRSYVASWAVRRLTPTECERLQGFPDNYTAVPYRKKPAADGPRYKALGNSMAVNVMRVLGERIQLVEAA